VVRDPGSAPAGSGGRAGAGCRSIGTSGGLRLGHFAAMRWTDPDEAAAETDDAIGEQGDEQPAREVRLPEVFIGGEGLVRGPADVLATLLHEAAHALAHVRGIKDTSRQGRWHNAKFKALAEELGIEVTKDPRIGWSPTAIPTSTRERYAEVIDELGRALRLYRSVEIGAGGRAKSRHRRRACAGADARSASRRLCSPPAPSHAESAAATSPPTYPSRMTKTNRPRRDEGGGGGGGHDDRTHHPPPGRRAHELGRAGADDTASLVVTTLFVRAEGLVPARLDIAHVDTPDQQLGLTLGAVLIYINRGSQPGQSPTGGAAHRCWHARSPRGRGRSGIRRPRRGRHRARPRGVPSLRGRHRDDPGSRTDRTGRPTCPPPRHVASLRPGLSKWPRMSGCWP